jgi:hypothetical protein
MISDLSEINLGMPPCWKQDKQDAWEHEVATWRLAAEQAAAVAERAQQQVGEMWGE